MTQSGAITYRIASALAVALSLLGAAAMPQAHAADLPPNPSDCITSAARFHNVSPYLLRAIAWQESRMNPLAVNRNTNGSVDIGALQINSIHLPRLKHYGVDVGALKDPCVSAYVGAWILRDNFETYGDTWRAIGAYNSRTPALNARYANSIMAILHQWGIQTVSAPSR